MGDLSQNARGAAPWLQNYIQGMPMPKRASVDDYFAQLDDVQRPHLEALRVLSTEVDPEAREVLKWNLPVFVRGENTNQWMLQNFKHHCSLRFSPEFFASQKAVVEAAGYEFGEGFIKLPYERELPIELLKTLMQARLAEFEGKHPV
jgi:uncharacterized protein YdhG (YjbR/CyaY superfamily)